MPRKYVIFERDPERSSTLLGSYVENNGDHLQDSPTIDSPILGHSFEAICDGYRQRNISRKQVDEIKTISGSFRKVLDLQGGKPFIDYPLEQKALEEFKRIFIVKDDGN